MRFLHNVIIIQHIPDNYKGFEELFFSRTAIFDRKSVKTPLFAHFRAARTNNRKGNRRKCRKPQP